VGNIELEALPKSTPNVEEVTSLNRLHQNQNDVGNPCLSPPSSFDHKQKKGVKKNLTMTTTIQEELNDNVAFSNDEDGDGTSISSKGSFEKDQHNDQSVESPLKKIKNKKNEKILVTQRVFVSTKTRVTSLKMKATKHVGGKPK